MVDTISTQRRSLPTSMGAGGWLVKPRWAGLASTLSWLDGKWAWLGTFVKEGSVQLLVR